MPSAALTTSAHFPGLLFPLSSESPPASRPESELDALLGLSLDDFAQAGLVVAVFSKLFGETVLLVSDNAVSPLSSDTVCYGVGELRRILAGGLEELHRIHALKRTLLRAGTPASIDAILLDGAETA